MWVQQYPFLLAHSQLKDMKTCQKLCFMQVFHICNIKKPTVLIFVAIWEFSLQPTLTLTTLWYFLGS
jgi:hypothetical protein